MNQCKRIGPRSGCPEILSSRSPTLHHRRLTSRRSTPPHAEPRRTPSRTNNEQQQQQQPQLQPQPQPQPGVSASATRAATSSRRHPATSVLCLCAFACGHAEFAFVSCSDTCVHMCALSFLLSSVLLLLLPHCCRLWFLLLLSLSSY